MNELKIKLQSHETTHSTQIKALRLVFLLLPPPNYHLLRDLLSFLHRVAFNSSYNKMDASNLGTMFAPHILCPRKVSKHKVISCCM